MRLKTKLFFATLLVTVGGLTNLSIASAQNVETNNPSSTMPKIRIVLVGDSTVNDGGGWGYGFKQFLTTNAVCLNTAANGRSSKSFIAEGRWEKALALKGDYYIFQFGHNDEPGKGPARATDPNTTYYQNMARYVNETRAVGAKPVLVTSLTRRTFDKSGNGKITSTLTPYVEAIRRLAAAEHVPLVDLNAISMAYCEKIGPAKTAEFNAVKKDGKPDTTHLNRKGQLVFAQEVVEALRQAVPALAPCLLSKPNPAAVVPKSFNVKKFGATGDGTTDDTKAVQSALDACGAAGGGTVEIPAGTYLIRPIFLKGDGLTLQLDEGAKLQATTNFSDFSDPEKPGAVFALVNAKGLNDLTIKGQGVIDGAGAAWWPEVRVAKKNKVPEPRRRPRLVMLQKCLDLNVEGITLQNSPSFHLVPSDCEAVTIENIKIHAPADAPNTDAMDPSACRHLLIRNCTFDVGDDNIAIKSGHVDPAHPGAAVEDVLVENCTFLHGHGMSIGSETIGGVKNLLVRDCTFDGTTSGIRIKSDRTRGGAVTSCTYSNLTMKNVTIPINITSYYPKIPQTDTAQPMTDRTPQYRDLKIVNLTAESPRSAGFLVGLPECCISNVVFQNVKITAPSGMIIRNARGVEFKNSAIETKSGAAPVRLENAEVAGLK